MARKKHNRTSRFNLLLTPEERKKLEALESFHGISKSDVMRQLLAKAHREMVRETRK